MCDEVRRLKKEGVKRQLNPLRDTTGISYRPFEAFSIEQQIELMHRCETQEWVGVCDATLPTFGRALISLQRIRKDDVIVDYHGLVVRGVSLEDYATRDYVASEYCLEVDQKPKRIIDATSEICTLHPGNRCLGRLANHARQSKGSVANMSLADVELTAIPETPRVVILQARVDIEPFQQLRFDYNDRVAHSLFKE